MAPQISGACLWSQIFGGATDDEGLGIAVDAVDNSYITGYFTGTMTIGAANATAVDGEDAFLITSRTCNAIRV